MEFFSDEALAIFVPIVVYWVYSGMYMALGQSMDKYRLHPRKEENSKNLVSKREVIKGVLLQQLVQAGVAAVVFTVRTLDHSPYSYIYAWLHMTLKFLYNKCSSREIAAQQWHTMRKHKDHHHTPT
jgi:hypothetical protein